MKKIISTRFHGILDYCFGLVLMMPWIVNFNEWSDDTWLLAAAGMFTMLISLLTNYECSFIRLIPMKLHLFLDLLVAVFLIGLPILRPMTQYYLYWPMALGILEVLIVLFTSLRPFVKTKRDTNITLPSA